MCMVRPKSSLTGAIAFEIKIMLYSNQLLSALFLSLQWKMLFQFYLAAILTETVKHACKLILHFLYDIQSKLFKALFIFIKIQRSGWERCNECISDKS